MIARDVSRTPERIDHVLQIYVSYLDSEVVALLSEVRASPFLTELVELVERPDLRRGNPQEQFRRFIVESPKYDAYWGLIGGLDERLVKTKGR